MRTSRQRPSRAGLWRDLDAVRRYLWLPVATIAVAVIAALAINITNDDPHHARFRSAVFVDALPPLFGPAVLPSPFDYARLATSDGVVADVAGRTDTAPDDVRPRLRAEVRPDKPEIQFEVTGPRALDVARAWEQAFNEAAVAQTPSIERLLTTSYARQLDEARAALERTSAGVVANPDDLVARQELSAAQANYETASKLAQSYDVVARTIQARPVTVVPPRERSSVTGGTPGRIAAATALGLLAGVVGAVLLDMAARDRARPMPQAEPREPIDVRPAFRRRTRQSAR